MLNKYKRIVIDVDGVMTKPYFMYTRFGKAAKFFSADDKEAVELASRYYQIHFVTADFRGLKISKKRIIKDMKQKLSLVSANERKSWIEKLGDTSETVYIGDSFTDISIFKVVGKSYCPSDANHFLKPFAAKILISKGGERAVAEMCLDLLIEEGKITF